ncbi:MAG TPA: hypothetical protein EYH54_00970 [Nautiliaceae bacterium]|nr:hypothetical protein [Nautiliaceae bacterium]
MDLFTNRANQSIFFSLFLLKEKGIKEIFIPDQGAWYAYKLIPKYLGFKIRILKTELGVPEEEELKKIKNSTLIICSSPGYLRDLSKKMWQIKEILNENNSFLINDNSSGFSFDGDIVLMSFGYWKPINLGLGGLLRINNEELLKTLKEKKLDEFFKLQIKLDEKTKKKAKERLNKLESLVKEGIKIANEYKKRFKDFLIKELKNENSLNVALKYDKELIETLKKEGLPFRKMPDYIRLKIKGISLESKRISYPKP